MGIGRIRWICSRCQPVLLQLAQPIELRPAVLSLDLGRQLFILDCPHLPQPRVLLLCELLPCAFKQTGRSWLGPLRWCIWPFCHAAWLLHALGQNWLLRGMHARIPWGDEGCWGPCLRVWQIFGWEPSHWVARLLQMGR